ncbi:MAG: type I-C CRISPR-associated protein Cas8c/Csd1 [Rhodospirillales bacterium]|nr:type I-C CRISPR-associated protein Cas8c/Csd1 [Rhodospirillales bacterium]
MNAPVSERAAFAYATALNHLLRGGEQNRQRLQIADATTLFWAEARSGKDEAASAAEEALGWFADPPPEETLDALQQARVRVVLEQVAQGRPLREVDPRLDEGTRLFVLGLAPNAARLSVRFWHVNTLGKLAERFHQHWQDLAIEPLPWKRAPAIWRLLYETAAQRKAENIPPNVNGGAIPGHCGGVKAGHLGESGAAQQGARSGPLLCRRFASRIRACRFRRSPGLTVSAVAWFCSARSAGVAGRRRPADCFRR